MKMPDGWQTCFEVDTSTDRGREMIVVALNLMKEMAECLEHHVEDCGMGFNDKELLKKFKEWKF
jgi:hypothetical protein